MPQQPDPGITRRAAVIAFSLGTIYFGYAFIQRVAPSVMTSELMRDFSVGGAVLGSLSAFYFYTYAAIQLPVGMMTDRFGPRKLMSFAAALCAVASVIFATSESLFMASVGRGLVGATVAFAFVGTLAIAGYWFKASSYAMLAGVLQAVGMGGAIFGQAPLRFVVENIGWRGSMMLLAGFALVLAVLLYTQVPRRTTGQKDQEEHGGIFDGFHAVTRNLQTWLCALIGFGMASSMLGFGGLWAVPWMATVLGYSTAEAAGIASMLFVGWALFSPFVGWMSDRIGRRNIIMTVGALIQLVSISCIFYLAPESTPKLMALFFCAGMGGSTMTVCFSSVKEHNSLAYSSTSLGLMNMCVVGSGAVMQPLIGWLLDQRWDGTLAEGARVYSMEGYTFALTSLVFVTGAALVGTLLLKETHCRQLK